MNLSPKRFLSAIDPRLFRTDKSLLKYIEEKFKHTRIRADGTGDSYTNLITRSVITFLRQVSTNLHL